ncbi:unnamed protein product [Didymodactylos carnosus]|uniref:Caffeoyl-CoA O-methyltransferase n=1 Tax=Didymodactylos carnosus TaxID=1234261 RepID=A0A8S2F456_9BILA|nr:unnamed protein product [Didymodactylos carnosus]CAF4158186.1 unnamed protein product [Didymodactylos carnosus]
MATSPNFTNSTKAQYTSDPITQYICDHSLRLTPEQTELIEYTKTLPGRIPFMLGSIHEAQFFQVLLRLMNCKRCIEVGTLTGCTTLTIALALPDDGQIVTLDVDDQYIRM